MKTFIGYQRYLAEEIANSAIHDKLVATGVVGKHSKRTEPRVFNLGDKLSNADFSNLIKSTFDGVDKVTVIPPPNIKSRTNTIFNFDWEGVAYSVTLAGEVKGRGSKQTAEQEVSWLLVLSAYFYDKTIEGWEDLKETMLIPMVYERVFGAKGSALKESGAVGLIRWLEGQQGWKDSHMAQCKSFVKGKEAPARLLKDRSNMDITAIAKSLFPLAVPDQTFDKDKWNPADVWLEYEDVPAPASQSKWGSLAELNNYLLDSIDNKRGVIGVSLKLGTGKISHINKKKRPAYEVTDFDLKFGDLFAQNVPAEYEGTFLEGYSVTYRVFDAKATSTIRGEAQVKKGLAAQGKVYLKYLDFLMGGKRTYVSRVEAVKGILVKEALKYTRKNVGKYIFTKQGEKAFKIIQREWPKLRDSDIMEYGRGKLENYNKLVDKPGTKRTDIGKEFLDYVAEYAHKNKIDETGMQTRVSVRFQTIRLGALFAGIKKGSKERLHQGALGMLLYGKSESSWSASHLKAQ